MNILMLSWRDTKNPKAGGAEILTKEIAKRWVAWGEQVTWFTASYPGGTPEDNIEGINIIRRGSQATVHWQAFRYYQKHLKGQFDIVIDQINTIPFLTPLYVRRGERRLSFIPQLCREIWFFEAPFPKIISALGYLIEPLYLQPYRFIPAITISDSTKEDLHRLGIKRSQVFPMAVDVEPLPSLEAKPQELHFIFVGRVVPSKRVDAIIEAFHQFQQKYPASLDIVGPSEDLKYRQKLNGLIQQYALQDSVIFHGKVSNSEKYRLMQQARAILVTSVREGWGLIVTEANAVGTPAVVYNVNGLRDSVRHEETGLVTAKNEPNYLTGAMTRLIEDSKLYNLLRYNAWEWSKQLTWESSAHSALEIIKKLGSC